MVEKSKYIKAQTEMLGACSNWDNQTDSLTEAFDMGIDFQKEIYREKIDRFKTFLLENKIRKKSNTTEFDIEQQFEMIFEYDNKK